MAGARPLLLLVIASEWAASGVSMAGSDDGCALGDCDLDVRHHSGSSIPRGPSAMRGAGVCVDGDGDCKSQDFQPVRSDLCGSQCSNACVLSLWEAWSPCVVIRCGQGSRVRSRRVIGPPPPLGATCADLVQTEACPPPRDACTPVGHEGPSTEGRSWFQVGLWSICLPSASPSPASRSRLGHKHVSEGALWKVEMGWRRRDVTCVADDGFEISIQRCRQAEVPPVHQPCLLPRDCTVGLWGPWGPCSLTCRSDVMGEPDLRGAKSRLRSLLHPSLAGGQPCPPLVQMEECGALELEQLPICPQFYWRGSEWSECQPEIRLHSDEHCLANQSEVCGGGIQTRHIYCAVSDQDVFSYQKSLPDDKDSVEDARRPTLHALLSLPVEAEAPQPVDPSKCSSKRGLERSRPCDVPCPSRCKVSTWGPWGPCIPDGCTEPPDPNSPLRTEVGFVLRERKILEGEPQSPGGCPHLVEAMPCHGAQCHRWHVAEVSGCIPSNGRCGLGTQFQRLICLNRHGIEVGPDLCGPPDVPTQLTCRVPCPGDCVLSNWGSWSSCSHSCSDGTTAGVLTRARAILALPGDGGRLCPSPTSLLDHRPCRLQPCAVHLWQASPWTACTPITVKRNDSRDAAGTGPRCGAGRQIRQVLCIHLGMGQVFSDRCPKSLRPVQEQLCLVPCPVDCVLTPFSEWTPCPEGCLPAGAVPQRQSRFAVLIRPASHGGRPCPQHLRDERECKTQSCPHYRWKAHRWQACRRATSPTATPREDLPCGHGLQLRDVSCRGGDGEMVEPHACLVLASLPPLSVSQPCRLPCPGVDRCSFSPWSPWSPCPPPPTCGMPSTRRRSLIGRSRRRDGCRDPRTFPLVESRPCPCVHPATRPVGKWSDCVLPPASPATLPLTSWVIPTQDCGPGVTYRALSCLDQEGRLLDPTFCGNAGYQEEACLVPCPSDCHLTIWSPWSACSVACGPGINYRSRWPRERSYNGGRPCPPMNSEGKEVQMEPCVFNCGRFVWETSLWDVCHAIGSCGDGTQRRTIRCVVQEDDGSSVEVNKDLCDEADTPQQARMCHAACTNECVMSEWGPWTRCPQPCDATTVRLRSRFTLRMPAEGHSCPDDTHSEHCSFNHNCFHFFQNLTDWSSCLLPEGSTCGRGKRFRLPVCWRSDGKAVLQPDCHHLPQLPAPEQSCLVECPTHCRLSDWGSWSPCSHSCGLAGSRQRSRHELVSPRGGGRPCPSQLEQSKPCPARPCFRWQLSHWSDCRVEGGGCGEGIRRRELSCHVFDGTDGDPGWPTEAARCNGVDRLDVDGEWSAAEFDGRSMEEQDYEALMMDSNPIMVGVYSDMRSSCYVPCPGECLVEEWSEWGPCHATCFGDQIAVGAGRQVRSRGVVRPAQGARDTCRADLWETQDCTESTCFTYRWQSGPWRDQRRQVWCQQSDGINVTGGCAESARPVSEYICKRSCLLPNSFCAPGGMCACEDGYQAIHTPRGDLEHCRAMWPRGTRLDGMGPDVAVSRPGREHGNVASDDRLQSWPLQPYGPDGRLSTWVWGVAGAGLVLLAFLVCMICLACRQRRRAGQRQRNLAPPAVAFDCDADL